VVQLTQKPRVPGTLPDASLFRHRNFNLINRNCGAGLTERIAGGQNATPGEFPWLAILQYNGKLTYPDMSSSGNLITGRDLRLYMADVVNLCLRRVERFFELVLHLPEKDMSILF
jgi:hypothetical protein